MAQVETETRLSPTGRVEAFSDGVMAIAITLLVPGYDAAYARAEWRRGFVGLPIYAAATLIALVLPLVALALYLTIAVFYAVTSQGVSSRTPSAFS